MKTFSFLSLLAVTAAGLFLSACSTNMSVGSVPDASVDYSKYKTYALHAPSDERRRPKFDTTIKEAIDRHLQGRQFQKVGKDRADFLVGYYTINLTRVRSQTVDAYYDYPTNRGINSPGYNLAIGAVSATDQYYSEGTLVIDIIDRKTGKQIWRGHAEKAIDEDNSDAAMRSIIHTAVAKVLKQYPPTVHR